MYDVKCQVIISNLITSYNDGQYTVDHFHVSIICQEIMNIFKKTLVSAMHKHYVKLKKKTYMQKFNLEKAF